MFTSLASRNRKPLARLALAITLGTLGLPYWAGNAQAHGGHAEMVPLQAGLEEFGATVKWDDYSNLFTIAKDGVYLKVKPNSKVAMLNGKRIAHGYFVLSAAAGLFVSPGVGPVLANYGLDTLRFINPVGIGDTIQARLTCKRKIDQGKKSPQGVPQGVVAWDVEVTNQLGELVASYDILTLVVKRED